MCFQKSSEVCLHLAQGCVLVSVKKKRFRVSGGASHAGDPQGHWRSFGHGTLWALEGVRRASNSGGHLLQGKHFGVGKISIFLEIFWAKLSSLEGEILEQQFLCLDYVAEYSRLQSSWLLPITWSLENIAKPGTVALFHLSTIQRCARTIHKKFWALEQISNARISTSSRWLFRPSSMKKIIYSRGKRQVSMIFANCSHGDTATIVDWGAKIVSVQRIVTEPFRFWNAVAVSGGHFRSVEQFGGVGSRIQLTDSMRRTLATFLRGLPGFVDIFTDFVQFV